MKEARIDIVFPKQGQALCFPHEFELIADIYIADNLSNLDGGLSAVIAVDGNQVSHLFSGILDTRLPSYVHNRSSVLEVVLFAADGSTLSREKVRGTAARSQLRRRASCSRCTGSL